MDTKERLKILDLLWYLEINGIARYIDTGALIEMVLPDDGGDKNHTNSMEKSVGVRTEHQIFKAIEEKAAREIFEEIEKWLATDGTLLIITAKKFAEIKNKYTEE